MENIINTEQNQKIEQSSTKSKVFEWLRFGLFLLALLIIIPNTIGIVRVYGFSMYPTFSDGNIVFEEKINKHFTSPELGDVVIVNHQVYDYKVVKRVIGVGGDVVEIQDGIIFVNHQPVNEIMTNGTSKDMAPIVVPEDHIFVIGDNREPGESIDSRDPDFGTIPLSTIDGYALFSIVPFSTIPKPIKFE